MSKFVKLSDGHDINCDAIAYISPITVEAVLKHSNATEWELAQAGVKKTPILEWRSCKSFTEVRECVAADPEHRGWSEDFTNPGYYEATEKLGYTSRRLDGKGKYFEVNNYVSTKKPSDVAYRILHLSVPCGGMNFSHVQFDITEDDYKTIACRLNIA